METRPSGKIEAQGLGIAAVSDKLLQQRAQDLAEQDGRTEPTDADRANALRDLRSPNANRAPEVPPGDENLTVWNQSPDVKNLFVVDGSSFVTGGSQNPTMTILSLSMRASEYLAEQMRAGNV